MDTSAEIGKSTLGHFERRVDAWVDDPAVFDPQQAVRRPVGEAHLSKAAADGEPRLIAVVPGLEHAERLAHQLVRIWEATDAPQLVDHDGVFELQLEWVCSVLPAATAAAFAVMRARRRGTAWSLAIDADELGTREIAPGLRHLYGCGFAWQPVRYEDDATVRQMPDCLAAEGCVGELDTDPFGG